MLTRYFYTNEESHNVLVYNLTGRKYMPRAKSLSSIRTTIHSSAKNAIIYAYNLCLDVKTNNRSITSNYVKLALRKNIPYCYEGHLQNRLYNPIGFYSEDNVWPFRYPTYRWEQKLEPVKTCGGDTGFLFDDKTAPWLNQHNFDQFLVMLEKIRFLV